MLSRTWTILSAIIIALAIFTCTTLAHAQNDAAEPADTAEPADATEPTTDGGETETAPADDPAAAYAAKKERWDFVDGELTLLRGRLAGATPDKQQEFFRQYMTFTQEMYGLVPELQETAIAAYEAKPNEDAGILKTLLGLIHFHMQSHSTGARTPGGLPETMPPNFAEALKIAKVLHKHKADVPGAASLIGTAAFYAGDDEIAAEMLPKAEKSKYLSEDGKAALAETKLRMEDAKANLPRVQLKLKDGDVVLELFEDQAPGAVGNFISLVEDGYYDGLTFHRVIDGYMAQGGDPTGDGSGGPGYNIYCECEKENARKHFAGALSMAHAGKDTGGSQFFITFEESHHLDGKHTVFGRVIEGMDAVNKITRRLPKEGEPPADKIIEATVLRKRDHEYKPNKVTE